MGVYLINTSVYDNPYAVEDVTILDSGENVLYQGNHHTDGLLGLAMDNGPFPGFNVNIDVHSCCECCSMPVQTTIWLFVSGLFGVFSFGVNMV